MTEAEAKQVEAKEYRRINANIQAIQLTHDVASAQAAVRLLGEQFAWTVQYGEAFLLYVKTALGTSTAGPGDWAIRNDRGLVMVMGAKEFPQVYEEAT